MGEESIRIPNRHTLGAGRLPPWAIDRPDDGTFGYFENEFGEQWVLLLTRDKALLAGGDCGWGEVYSLLHPPWKDIESGVYPRWPDLVMNSSERSWIQACLLAAARRFLPRAPGEPAKKAPRP